MLLLNFRYLRVDQTLLFYYLSFNIESYLSFRWTLPIKGCVTSFWLAAYDS